jgi:hypothetical protein
MDDVDCIVLLYGWLLVLVSNCLERVTVVKRDHCCCCFRQTDSHLMDLFLRALNVLQFAMALNEDFSSLYRRNMHRLEIIS